METLGAFLDAAVARAPAREALAAAPRAEVTARLGWAELRAASREAAKKLLAAGAGKGSRVGLLCTNRLEWLPIAFGALRLGAVLVDACLGVEVVGAIRQEEDPTGANPRDHAEVSLG